VPGATSLSVDSLTIEVRGRKVLDSVSFTVADEVLGVAGPNGAGKSTLLRAIESAAWRKRRGVHFSASPGSGRSTVGYLPQKFALPGDLRVREFVEYAAWVKGMPSGRRAAAQAIDAVRLVGERERKLRQVSGGVAQRTGFAGVLVDGPGVLLLDEPTTGVDIHQREVMRGIIADQSAGRVTLLSSHIIEDLEVLCDRILVLGDGAVRFLGTIDEAMSAAGEPSLSTALMALSGGPR
jgi:ABC-2 type transport system ATP-binding protein